MSLRYALLAAFCFAMGTVLMQRGTLQTEAGSEDPRFYVQILRRPVWLLGALFSLIGGGLHLLALSEGPVVLVEPVLTLSVVMALPLGVWLTGQHVHRPEIVGACMVIGGLTAFQVFANTTGGVSLPSAQRWLIGGGLTVSIAVGALWLSRGRRAAIVAAMLGIAAGAAFGLAAAFDKLFVNQIHHGPALLQWSLYALCIASLCGGAIQQAALKTGVLAPAIASVNVSNLLVAVALGLWVFQEELAHGNGRLVGAALGLALTVLGVMTLTGATAVMKGGRRAKTEERISSVATPRR